MTTTIHMPMTTEARYQQAANYFTQSGISHVLKRQWAFIREPDQKNFLMGSVLFTITAVAVCTKKGIEIGKDFSETLGLSEQQKDVMIICGGAGGFTTGVALSVSGNGYMIEHSDRMAKWKELRINQIVTDLMKEEFQNDPVWSQFTCPISSDPIYLPTRTPGGQVYDYNSLMQIADRTGVIRDVYNQTMPTPTPADPHATRTITYSIDACLKDSEMMIVICKRCRHLATQKSQEQGLSDQTREFFLSYRNSLGDLVRNIYVETQDKITKKRNDIQLKPQVAEAEVEEAERVHVQEMTTFKELFGDTPLSNIDWNVQRDWSTVLNKRWMAQYH